MRLKNFLDSIDYPVEEHLNNEAGFAALLADHKTEFETSQGVSASFFYYPIMFVGDQAFPVSAKRLKTRF